ncbi:MAG TPA: FHA domain-containing protein [Gemmatimonadales bacterium]|nr:FHA domain-containing protein [Gemmatimonadales bacterium]
MQSFLLSVLAQQYGPSPAEEFVAAFPDPWLLWESGTWSPAQATTLSLTIPRGTTSSSTPSVQVSTGGEALAFQLRLQPGKTEIVIGRAPPCELVINDATLSKRHATLIRGEWGWSLKDDGSRNGTWVSEVIIAPGRPVALPPGSRVRLGSARLLFLDSAGLHARLKR